MESLRSYVNTLLQDKNVEDLAIVDYVNNKCVWASKPGGLLAAISPTEVGVIVGPDRKTPLLTGITIAGMKCCIIRDNLMVEGDGIMDLRTKLGDSRSICIGKPPKALVFMMGKRGVPLGALNKKVQDVIYTMTPYSN